MVNWPLILLDSVSLDIFFYFDNLRFNNFFNVSFYKIILFHLKFKTDQKKTCPSSLTTWGIYLVMWFLNFSQLKYLMCFSPSSLYLISALIHWPIIHLFLITSSPICLFVSFMWNYLLSFVLYLFYLLSSWLFFTYFLCLKSRIRNCLPCNIC